MSKLILVIDDDAQIRALASTSLSMVGRWEVLTASSGAEGIAQAASAQPDAILLDMTMPGLDGRATLQMLRSDTSTAHIPVIMLTAAASANNDSMFGEPVAAVIPKPFDIMGLPRLVAGALDWEA